MDLQAMDRCHRIGQTKLVHVYRLATAQSVEGRMLKRAFSKLKLEHVVIEKGQFHQERTTTSIMDELERKWISLAPRFSWNYDDCTKPLEAYPDTKNLPHVLLTLLSGFVSYQMVRDAYDGSFIALYLDIAFFILLQYFCMSYPQNE